VGETTSLLSPSFGARATRNRQDFPRQKFGGAYYSTGYSSGGKSLNYALDTTALSHNTNLAYGIANDYTILAWIKPPSSGTETTAVIVAPGNLAQDTDGIQFSLNFGAVLGQTYRIVLEETLQTQFKDYRFGNTLPDDVWTHVGFTWNGTSLLCYQDATEDTGPLKVNDNAGTQTDASRRGGLGVNGKGQIATSFEGPIHSVAMWNTSLDASNITALYNGGNGDGLNLAEDSGNYNASASLVQWWLPGTQASPDLGAPAALSPGSIDFFTEAGFTGGSILDDAPTG
jgi:hypothetical protein